MRYYHQYKEVIIRTALRGTGFYPQQLSIRKSFSSKHLVRAWRQEKWRLEPEAAQAITWNPRVSVLHHLSILLWNKVLALKYTEREWALLNGGWTLKTKCCCVLQLYQTAHRLSSDFKSNQCFGASGKNPSSSSASGASSSPWWRLQVGDVLSRHRQEVRGRLYKTHRDIWVLTYSYLTSQRSVIRLASV